MMETYLSLNGYNIINLAPSAPSNSIMSHISEKNPDLILISVTLKEHLRSCERLVKNLKKFKIPIIVGGQALENENRFDNVRSLDDGGMSKLSKMIKEEIR
mgnify:FL=1